MEPTCDSSQQWKSDDGGGSSSSSYTTTCLRARVQAAAWIIRILSILWLPPQLFRKQEGGGVIVVDKAPRNATLRVTHNFGGERATYH
jgi:hypothetical protein